MSSPYFGEIFEYSIKEFKQHIQNETNERIIFSGKYGVGKTSFLKTIFEEKNQNSFLRPKEYNVYRLFPVNYSIASNEDIIRYIKYDIIVEILHKIDSVDEIELDFIYTLPQFVQDNAFKVAAIMANMIPVIGKDVGDTIEKIEKLQEKFLKFHKEANESTRDKMTKYLERLKNHDGSLYDNDIITKIIVDTIAKNKSDKSESVLIVDDIDRLDPEHVFRILNVFAAHLDNNYANGMKNKFGFDKIIIVCDFNNIRNLFHHRYGNEVDFMGYIDKFYSSDIFYFDNSKALIEIIKNIFSSINYPESDANKNVLARYYFNNGFIQNLLELAIKWKPHLKSPHFTPQNSPQ